MQRMWLSRFVVFASLACCGAEQSKPEAQLTVRVYNFAKVSRQTLQLAEETAAWIFRHSGIELQWVDCPISTTDNLKFPECAPTTDPLTASIRILPQPMSERFALPAAKFGVALPPDKVFVFFDRVEAATEDTGFSRPKVLAHVMAHELGHLLIQSEVHSITGIMTENLLSKDCQRPGVLVFTPSQGEQMRAQLQRQLFAKN